MATAECHFGSGLNSSSGGELKLYLKWKRNTTRLTLLSLSISTRLLWLITPQYLMEMRICCV